MWRSEENLWQSAVSVNHMDPRESSSDARLGVICLYLLSHSSGFLTVLYKSLYVFFTLLFLQTNKLHVFFI